MIEVGDIVKHVHKQDKRFRVQNMYNTGHDGRLIVVVKELGSNFPLKFYAENIRDIRKYSDKGAI